MSSGRGWNKATAPLIILEWCHKRGHDVRDLDRAELVALRKVMASGAGPLTSINWDQFYAAVQVAQDRALEYEFAEALRQAKAPPAPEREPYQVPFGELLAIADGRSAPLE